MSAAAAREPMAPLLAAYLAYLRDEKRYSPHTLAAARRDLGCFLDYCASARVQRPAQIDVHLIRGWLAAQRRAGREPASLHRYLSMLRGWLRFLLREGEMAANPALGVRAPRRAQRLPATIDAETLGATLDGDAGSGDFALRDRAIVELFYSAGLRLAELQQLDLAALDMQRGDFTVRGKGGKERLALLGGKARSALAAWLACRDRHARRGEPALFVSSRGGRLSRAAIAQRLRLWAQRTGLGMHLHPHRLRHAFATHMLENSGDLRAVQEMLGHAHLSTTQIYTHLDWKHLAAVYDGAHPRARRGAPRQNR